MYELATTISSSADCAIRPQWSRGCRLLDLSNLYFSSSPEADKLKIEGAVLADLKRIMTAKGFYRGDTSGPWDDAILKALDAFVASENFEERVDLKGRTIDAPVLAHLRSQA